MNSEGLSFAIDYSSPFKNNTIYGIIEIMYGRNLAG